MWRVKLHGATAIVQKLNNGKGVPEYHAQVRVKKVNDLEKRGDSFSKHFKRGLFSSKDPSIDDVKTWLRSVEEKLKERDRKATPKHMGVRKQAADRAAQEKRERAEAEARAKQEAEEASRREYEERRAAEYRAEQEEEDRRRAQAHGAPRPGESQEERDRKHARNQRRKKRRK